MCKLLMSNNFDVKWWKLIWEMLDGFLSFFTILPLFCVSQFTNLGFRSSQIDHFSIHSHIRHVLHHTNIYPKHITAPSRTSPHNRFRDSDVHFRSSGMQMWMNINELNWKLARISHNFHCTIHNAHIDEASSVEAFTWKIHKSVNCTITN